MTSTSARELRSLNNQDKNNTNSAQSSISSTSMLAKEDQPSALEQALGIDRIGLQILNTCYGCADQIKPGTICEFCRMTPIGIKCSICHLQGRGRTTFCLKCAHGGHVDHMFEWFVQEKNFVCPTGCGCHCLDHYGGWVEGKGAQNLAVDTLKNIKDSL